jgi:tRNA-splicing ligase RtcB
MNVKIINGCPVKIWTDKVEKSAMQQIENLTTLPFLYHHLAIMPDVHTGMGMPIGGVLACVDAVIPNAVGVDIGCGMCAVKTNWKVSAIPTDVMRKKIMNGIRNLIPLGMEHHEMAQDEKYLPQGHNIESMEIVKRRQSAILHEIGTLGGGNHFIEAYDNGWLAVHSGSRNIGLKVAQYYQKLAEKRIREYNHDILMGQLKSVEPSKREEWLKNHKIYIEKDLCYLMGQDMDDYLHDVEIMQTFAVDNRNMILRTIVSHMGGKILGRFSSTHNYIDTRNMILRKGAISAEEGEYLVIPLNMRDGLLICKGKGNNEWNCSAPHGAGRLYSRSKAKELFTVEEYAEEMNGIFSTCINESTLDEAPFAYKDYKEIMECVEPTVDIVERLIPIFNFKAN